MTDALSDETPMDVDEETFVFPAAWRKFVLPRRGGSPGPVLATDAAGGEELMRAAKASIEAYTHPANDPELIAAATGYLADPTTGSATGAGVVAGLVAAHIGRNERERLPTVADAWVASRGVVFAAEAVVQLAGVQFDSTWTGGRRIDPRVLRHPGGGWTYFPHWEAVAGRVRAMLAVASEDEYATAIAALEGLRSQSPECRVATSFLLPTQRAWVDADCAELTRIGDQYLWKVLWCSASSGEQLGLLGPAVNPWWMAGDTTGLATATDGVGPAVAPHLLPALDSAHVDADRQRRILAAIARFPTDEAFASLIARLDRKYVTPAALEAARRFPRRALRLLAADGTRAAADLLRAHVLAHRELATAQLAGLAPTERARVEAILTESAPVPEAPARSLPPVLVTPPWTVKRKAAKPIVVDGLEFTGEPVIAWALGEQERWATPDLSPRWWRLNDSIETALEQYRAGTLRQDRQVSLMFTGPDELVASLLPDWRPGQLWGADLLLAPLIARHGLAALPVSLDLAGKVPTANSKLLLPYASVEVVAHMASLLGRLKSLRGLAMSWLERHWAYAARALVPAALGKAGPARRAAEEALRLVAVRHRDGVLAAADGYGQPARAGVEALLNVDPLRLLPARVPALPSWAEPGLLPRILLKDRSAALGDRATRHLCTMLAISKPGDVYAGVPLVRDLCDRHSLAEFGWALFNQWQLVGAPAKEGWPLQALRWLGDDETVRRLSPVIRAWPGTGGHAKALVGLDILTEIGSDLALMHLHSIARKVKFKALRDRAEQKVAEVAAGLGLTAEQLADRLVPDFGLDANGSLTLDYGPRRFIVGFDEQLKPYVADESGARRKALPKPGAHDDRQLAPAAYQRFSGLKKDVRAVAADQIRRLEAAMVAQRRWAAADFRDYFVAHPLLWHIVRRLLWTATVGDGEPVAFRVAEDRTFADLADDGYELPADATVGLAHPVLLGERVAAWSEVFADYAILQPFPQLGRPVYELTDDERAATGLGRFTGLKVATTTLLGLERRGWLRGEPQDAGVQAWMWRPTPAGRAVVVDLDPGIPIGAPDMLPDQMIHSIWVNGRPRGDWLPRNPSHRFGELDPITASETLRDLTEVLVR
ncbi:DUF4132 domain-containing protein [Rugosimonospora acidiphila]|uniref:DUF4132 domain-containing protein n=1 Tax=Rugosimonospora acidiphila TaxID=556531 RepID=UPI0031F03AD3